MEKLMVGEYRGKSPEFYQRTFMAEFQGKTCGLMQLKFHGDQFDSKYGIDMFFIL